jgi:hypothetical protein
MKKMIELRQHLAQSGCFHADGLETWVEDMQLKPRGKVVGESVLLHVLRYRAVFAIASYPYKQHPVEQFNATLMTWLAEHDDRSDLDNADPDISVDVWDDHTASLELTLMFNEEVYITPDDNGSIEFKGTRWSLLESQISVAEACDIEARQL